VIRITETPWPSGGDFRNSPRHRKSSVGVFWPLGNRCSHSRSACPEYVVTECPFASNRCAAHPRTSTIRVPSCCLRRGRWRLHFGKCRVRIARSSTAALRSVAPNFDEASLSLRKDGPETYIAFTGEMELDDSQLSLLGLKDRTRSSISGLPQPDHNSVQPQTRIEAGPKEWHGPALSISIWESER